MHVTNPYGTTRTKDNKRKLILRNNRKNTAFLKAKSENSSLEQDIPKFADENPNLLIAQWISAIDKIIKKPKPDKKPTTTQYNARIYLGAACWKILKNRESIANDIITLQETWDWKLHPYKQTPDDSGDYIPNIKGRWFTTFCGDVDEAAINNNKVAKNIESHLHNDELTIIGTKRRSSHKVGLIESRAKSIENNVLKPRDKQVTHSWSNSDEAALRKNSDLAEQIYLQNEWLENQERGSRKIWASEVGEIIFAHYKNQFQTKTGGVFKRQDIRETQKGLLNLYDEIKPYYKRLLRGTKKKTLINILPKNNRALISLLGKKNKNRDVNGLIRLGRIMHYEAARLEDESSSIERMGVGLVLQHGIENSNYWTSEGQAEIKRSEAFVRVWRNTISQAGRTLKAWVDPFDNIEGDMLGDMPTMQRAAGEAWGKTYLSNHLKVLFGASASQFTKKIEDMAEFAHVAMNIARKSRNQVFHFRGRKRFVSKLKEALNSNDIKQLGDRTIQQAITDFLAKDREDLKGRIYGICEGAQLNAYAGPNQLNAYLELLNQASDCDIVLPKFNRLLLRLENTGQRESHDSNGKTAGTLPMPGKAVDLEKTPLLAKHTGFKLVYEGPFRLWLNSKKHDYINRLIDKVVVFGTSKARRINGTEKTRPLIFSKAADMERLVENETLKDFLENLTAETASEMRVQNAYESVGKNAKEQAEWIDHFRCDVIGRAFHDFVEENALGWLLKLSEVSNTLPNITLMPRPSNTRPREEEQWLAYIYLLLHMVPVDDIVRLAHQFRKWGALEFKAELGEYKDADVAKLREVLLLYIKMHDDKFDGQNVGISIQPFRDLYENPKDFNDLFCDPDDEASGRLSGTRRGLREIMRFGHMPLIKNLIGDLKITHSDVLKVASLERKREGGGASDIVSAQTRRKALHKKAIGKDIFTDNDLNEYRNLVQTIVSHRESSAHVKLLNHVKLHRLLMRIISRLIDFAGLWERDKYFITLGLAYQENVLLKDLFANTAPRNGFRKQGIVDEQKMSSAKVKCLLEKFHTPQRKQIRNDLDHFNILSADRMPVNLTNEINLTRQLMAYDRKLKNAVSKSVIEMMDQEGFTLTWKMNDHMLEYAKIETRNIPHLKKAKNKTRTLIQNPITEPFHDVGYESMVKKLFR